MAQTRDVNNIEMLYTIPGKYRCRGCEAHRAGSQSATPIQYATWANQATSSTYVRTIAMPRVANTLDNLRLKQ